MGGESLRRYFLDAYFSKGFWGAFHAFLQIVFISRSPLYLPGPPNGAFPSLWKCLREAREPD